MEPTAKDSVALKYLNKPLPISKELGERPKLSTYFITINSFN